MKAKKSPEIPFLETHLHYFYKWEQEKPNGVFLRQPYGSKWREITWREAGDEARRIASALQAMGVQKGSLVGLLSKNCAHWILADLSILMCGAVCVPFYPNLAANDLSIVLEKSEVTHLFVGKLDPHYWESVRHVVPPSIRIIRFPDYPASSLVRDGEAWDELLKQYQPLKEAYSPKRSDLWTILYTSGTTGTPKGVMLEYRSPALFLEHESRYREIGVFDLSEGRFFSYLPLNHIAERLAIELSCLVLGGTISFAESIETFPKNLQETQPTFFFGVPRIWQRFRLAVMERFGGEERYHRLIRLPILGSLLKRVIRRRLGLAKVELAVTGAAQTPDAVKLWFQELGIFVRDIYAMTENCAGCTVMPKDRNKLGTVGKPLKEVRLKIDEETGEVLMWADWVMKGYYKDPEKTAEVFRDGWLHTGDTGELDEEGFLRITGRLSDAFKTAKGLFVVPAPLEEPFARLPYAEQVCVVGLGQVQPLVLLTLSEIGRKTDKTTVEQAITKLLDEVNAPLPTYQKLAKAVLLSEIWSVENSLLTPTLKVRRREIDKRYGPYYEEWLTRPEKVIWITEPLKEKVIQP
ncbi:MAG: AMP-binding protein [Bacteroidia bacterium]|nr:AMP-binding protein [Bacteroidia bacterium]MDW8015023.1 AMP-binding protein [Bacteroidia bacterium]